MFVRATVSKTDIFEERPLETKALSRSGVMAIRTGKVPTGISLTTLFEVSITAVVLEYLVVTKRCGAAEAGYAKANAKIINSKGRQYVLIVTQIRLSPALRNPPRTTSSLIFGNLRFSSVCISAGDWTTEHWSRTAILNPPAVGPPHEVSPGSQNHFFC